MRAHVAVLAAATALLVGCSAAGTPDAGPGAATSGAAGTGAAAAAAACGSGPVLVWSGQTARPSYAQVVRTASGATGTAAAGATGGRAIDVLDITSIPGEYRVGDHQYVLSDGDEGHDETHLVDWDATTCTARTARLDEVFLPLDFTTDGTRFVTANTRNGRTEFRRYDRDGVLQREATVGAVLSQSLSLDGDTLYAVVAELRTDGGPDGYDLLTMDAATLAVRSRRTLPLAKGPVASTVVHDGTLIYPLTADDDGLTATPRHSLVVLDLATWASEEIDLGSDLPYLLRLDGDTLYVGHTFINPGFGDISTLRHVSVVDLSTGSVRGHDLDAGILDLQVDGDTLYLLGILEDYSEDAVVETYRVDTMARTSSATVRRPTPEHHPAALWLP